MKNDNPKHHPLKMLGWTSLIGMEVALLITLGYFGGKAAARATGEPFWTLAGTLAGLAIGILSVVLMIRRFLLEDDHD